MHPEADQVWESPAESIPQALRQATGVYLCIHGHFYQPPRENPDLNTIEQQPSADPFHDWNERILHECYRPNAFARVLNDKGEILRIVNNYEYISFNIGPTLMSWLERHDLQTYQRILEADRRSCERLNGHGNAIAQAYNHIILPLANQRDKVTQVRWGKADFKARFGRDPEGMWLAETAVDYPTLEVLADEGIRFIILAPSQAQRCRPLTIDGNGAGDWLEVGGSQIDPTRPYRCFLPPTEAGQPRRHVDIFFYDGPISRDMGFKDILSSSDHFAGRLGQAVRGDHRSTQLISVATDGETFGHHRHGAEKALTYAVTEVFAQQGWTITNYAHYLSLSPPTWEVELKPVTAWSCAHGVDRWQDDCGCGGGHVWHQQWRRPLRDALDWLRDQLTDVYESHGSRLLKDLWQARNAYVSVIRDRGDSSLNAFFQTHQAYDLNPAERTDALRLLEMQRHALLMYTSCGWFFEEISRPEGTQILRYAGRAIELAGEVAGLCLEDEFIARLDRAPSNVDQFKTGAGVYRQLVSSSQISLEQVAAHYAMSSLFTHYYREQQIYCYTVHQLDYRLQRMGSMTLAVGQLQLVSEITREVVDLVFAVLHLGGWDFHCCIQRFEGRLAYNQAKDAMFESLGQASSAQVILAMNRYFGDRAYGLQDLFAEDRHRIMQLLSQETLTRLNQLYTQVYRDNYGVLMAFHRDRLPVPQALQVAAEIALTHRAMNSVRSLERDASDHDNDLLQAGIDQICELEAIAAEASQLNCQLKLPDAKVILERLILRGLWQFLHSFNADTAIADVEWLKRLTLLGDRLSLNLSLDRVQELYFQYLSEKLLPALNRDTGTPATDSGEIADRLHPSSQELALLNQILQLGQAIDIDAYALLTPF
ncbi:MAG: DUF3536 domain-containing protein [Cyanobacteria bacterium P01_A01_bin.123]